MTAHPTSKGPLLNRFLRDERGAVLILVTVMLPALVGFSLLAIDMSRVNNLHNDLQKAADAFALAAAAELDGRADAHTRAQLALATLVDNTSKFSDTPGTHILTRDGDITWRFLEDLPPNDADPITDDPYLSDGPEETRFIEVRVTPTGFSSIFPASFLGGADTFSVGASAVAGFKRSVCDVTPIFICNPFEDAGLSFAEAFTQGMTYSREFRVLKTASTPGPGNFGLLQTDLPLRDAFAMGNAGECYEQYTVETKPGVTLGHVNTGLNVRFDIYAGPLSGEKSNPNYRPAANVRKGADKPNQCNKFESNSDTPLKAMGFPEGTTGQFFSNEPGMSGDGWDRDAYWSLNHGVATMPAIPSTSNPVSNSAPPSRYDVYKYEIEDGIAEGDLVGPLVGDPAGGAQNGETGIPQCYKGPTESLTTTPDRRLIVAAVVNCDGIAGKTVLRPDAYVSMFLTNPVEKEDKSLSDDDENAAEKPIRLEVVDVAGEQGNGTLDNLVHDEAQLYR